MKRSIRLPPYLQLPIWQQLADSMNELFGPNVDVAIKKLRDLNRIEHIHPDNEYKVGEEMIVVDDMYDADRESWLDKRLRIKQATDLGFTFSDSSSVGQTFYEMLLAQGPQFWGEAGTKSIATFLGFLLNAYINVYPLWTRDYVDMEREIPDGGLKIYEGGDWYLTAHVDIEVNGNISSTINSQQLVELFYMIAPIHLVINSTQIRFDQLIGELKVAIAGRMIIWEADPEPEPDMTSGAAARFMVYDPQSTVVL